MGANGPGPHAHVPKPGPTDTPSSGPALWRVHTEVAGVGGEAPTSAQILFNKFHLQVEYLLLEFADGVFRSLAPCHHVAQISNLRKHKRDFSTLLKGDHP